MSSTVNTMFVAYGLTALVSMAVAVMIKGMTTLLAAMDKGQPTAAGPVTAVAQPSAPAGAEGDIAAIAAAVYAMLGESARIVRIEANGRGMLWTAGGRLMHQTSHVLQRRQPHKAY